MPKKITVYVFRSAGLLLLFALFPYYGKAQIKFIKNEGQWNEAVRYKANLHQGNLFVLPGELRYHLNNITSALHHPAEPIDTVINGHTIFLEWLNADKTTVYEAEGQFPEYYNYYTSRDRNRWRSRVRAYEGLRTQELYPGIDMLLESLGGALKLTYFVAPGSDHKQIKIKITGADDIFLQEDRLHITNTVTDIIEEKPYAYQLINGVEKEVKCFYSVKGNIVSFELPEGYDKTLPLVIDPTIIFATYSGSVADNFGFTATYDSAGNAYGGGTVYHYGFPTTTGAYQTTYANGVNDTLTISDIPRDCGILKFSDDGKSLLWATYLGGSGNEQPHSMIVDSSDRLVILGTTQSSDFPVTSTAYDTSLNGLTDIFISTLSSDGTSLLASTLVGGSGADGLNGLIDPSDPNEPVINALYINYGDQFRGEVIIDPDNNVYIASCTKSNNFPVSSNAYQKTFGGSLDAVAFKLDSNLSTLAWSTYLGASGDDAAYSLKVDSSRNVFVCGGTQNAYFFPDNTTFQKTLAGGIDGFIAHIKNDGSSIINATYLGTNKYDQTYFLQLDKNENVYVYGQTNADSFHTKNVNYYIQKASQFVTRFENDLGTIFYSSTFGSGKGGLDISPTAFLVDDCEKIYVSGWGASKFMPLSFDAFQDTSQSHDFYIAVFAKNFDTLLYGSYFGGPDSYDHVDGGTSRFDKKGTIYQSICAGCGGFSDFPTTQGAWSTTNKGKRPPPNQNQGGCNNLVLKIDLEVPDIRANFEIPYDYWCLTISPSIIDKSISAKSYVWYFGDGDSSTAKNPIHTYDDTGTYTITLVVTNFNSCNVRDTMQKTIVVYDHPDPVISLEREGCSNTFTFAAGGSGNDLKWHFPDTTIDSGRTVTYTFEKPGTYPLVLTTDSGTACADTIPDSVTVIFPYPDFTYTLDSCRSIIEFENLSLAYDSLVWTFNSAINAYEENPVIDYKQDTAIHVKLTAYDTSGCSMELSQDVFLPTALFAYFEIDQDTCKGEISFINKSSSIATEYEWDFGNGTHSNIKDPPPIIYDKDSTYTVRLIAKSGSGATCVDTFKIQLTHQGPPEASFTYNRDSCTNTIYFQNTSYRGGTFHWDFGDNTTSAIKHPSHKYKNGTFEVILIINSGLECADTFKQTILLKDRPEAGFEMHPDSCDFEVRFKDLSYNADSILWLFGDGDTSRQFDPVHDYGEPGYWTVHQVVNPGNPCSDTATMTLTIGPLPKASFDYKQEDCSYLVQFTNTSTRNYYSWWDFGDGESAMGINPIHPYPGPGTFTVRMIINGNMECADTVEKTITLGQYPHAKYSFDIDTCSYTVTFQDSSLTTQEWLWEFGDGTADTARHPVHDFGKPGQYKVTLTVNPNGCADTFSQIITLEKTPEADFVFMVDTCIPRVYFFDTSHKASSYYWIFEKDEFSKDKNPDHLFKRGGNHNVTLIINKGTPCEDSIVKSVFVPPIPKAAFDAYYDTCTPITRFYNNSIGAQNYYWDFGDGTSSTSESPEHIYENHGTYDVRLVINKGTACESMAESPIQVNYRQAAFKHVYDSCIGFITFINESEYAGTYQWDFGDGNTSDIRSPLHLYAQGGFYTIRLIINPGTQCADTAYLEYDEAVSSSANEIKIPNVITPNNDGYNDLLIIEAPVSCGLYELLVFNRWGELVFKEEDYRISWDGTFFRNGKPLPDGTYYFVFKTPQGTEFTGTINIFH